MHVLPLHIDQSPLGAGLWGNDRRQIKPVRGGNDMHERFVHGILYISGEGEQSGTGNRESSGRGGVHV